MIVKQNRIGCIPATMQTEHVCKKEVVSKTVSQKDIRRILVIFHFQINFKINSSIFQTFFGSFDITKRGTRTFVRTSLLKLRPYVDRCGTVRSFVSIIEINTKQVIDESWYDPPKTWTSRRSWKFHSTKINHGSRAGKRAMAARNFPPRN